MMERRRSHVSADFLAIRVDDPFALLRLHGALAHLRLETIPCDHPAPEKLLPHLLTHRIPQDRVLAELHVDAEQLRDVGGLVGHELTS